ncbi:hypothetical protein [Brachyspira innocens]|uniref:hypothetical protein n=1 Tax=Brachyspira innocens TaxID=13264 RepID=UPI00036B5AAE|nr:hypothetical protein [Brachyspira innocens]
MGFLSELFNIIINNQNKNRVENLYKINLSYKDDGGKVRYVTETFRAYNKKDARERAMLKYGYSIRIKKVKYTKTL